MTTGGVNKPLVGSCPKGGGHKWSGFSTNSSSSIYYCGKCGTVTGSIGKPRDGTCGKGGAHTWRKRN